MAITRLTATWEAEYHAFRQRDLSDRDYLYVWADGVHFNIRLEDDRRCTLVLVGVRPDGTKELMAVEDGYRENADSWATLLRDLARRGMRAPVVAVGDRALGFWAAVRDVWPETRAQRDWRHKMANVLDELPKRLQPKAKCLLRESCTPTPATRPRRGSSASWRTRVPSTRSVDELPGLTASIFGLGRGLLGCPSLVRALEPITCGSTAASS